MEEEIVLLDLFSGIGGFAKGLSDSGFKIKKHYFSEIDKHAIACYKYNFKKAEYVGSVTDVQGRKLERPNIITFGSPCQDFSLAGKRKGMEGKRSSLITEAIRLIDECRPDVFIWENVKGTFSSNDGADFWGIVQAFTNIGGYRLEWQLLNTSWFLPQNRERIYLIGHREDCNTRNIFPVTLNKKIPNEYEVEKVYYLSKSFVNRLFPKVEQRKRWDKKSMQEMLQELQSSISKGECQEIEREPQDIRRKPERYLQEIDTLKEEAQGIDNTGEVYGLVQTPGEEMLLLWDKRQTDTDTTRCIFEELQTSNDRQDGFFKRIRGGKYGSCLFTVQSYKGRLFYCIGDGSNWENVYIKKMELWQQNLKSILQEEVDQKYFLSEKQTLYILKTTDMKSPGLQTT